MSRWVYLAVPVVTGALGGLTGLPAFEAVTAAGSQSPASLESVARRQGVAPGWSMPVGVLEATGARGIVSAVAFLDGLTERRGIRFELSQDGSSVPLVQGSRQTHAPSDVIYVDEARLPVVLEALEEIEVHYPGHTTRMPVLRIGVVRYFGSAAFLRRGPSDAAGDRLHIAHYDWAVDAAQIVTGVVISDFWFPGRTPAEVSALAATAVRTLESRARQR